MLKINGNTLAARLASYAGGAAQGAARAAHTQGGVPTHAQAQEAIRHLLPNCAFPHHQGQPRHNPAGHHRLPHCPTFPDPPRLPRFPKGPWWGHLLPRPPRCIPPTQPRPLPWYEGTPRTLPVPLPWYEGTPSPRPVPLRADV